MKSKMIDQMEDERLKRGSALRNVSMLARRELRRCECKPRDPAQQAEMWRHIIRFCEGAGITSTCLREEEEGS